MWGGGGGGGWGQGARLHPNDAQNLGFKHAPLRCENRVVAPLGVQIASLGGNAPLDAHAGSNVGCKFEPFIF